jgi:hypothetical protein
LWLILLIKKKSPRKAKGGKAAKLFSPLYQEGLSRVQPFSASLSRGACPKLGLVPLGKGGQSLLASMASLETLGGFAVDG